MKINYSLILELIPFFSGLLENTPIKFGAKRKIMRFQEALVKEYQFFEKEIQSLAEQYCEKDEEGNFITVEGGGQKIHPDKISEANKSLEDIHTTEIEMTFEPFKLEEKYFEDFIGSAAAVRLIEENFLLEEAEAEAE